MFESRLGRISGRLHPARAGINISEHLAYPFRNASSTRQALTHLLLSQVASLQRALVKATKNDGKDVNQELSEDVQKLQRRIDEMVVIEDDLRKEVSEVRSEKEKEELARHEFVSSFQSELAEQVRGASLSTSNKHQLIRCFAPRAPR